MRFRVQTLRGAANDYREILKYIAKRSKSGAIAWANAFDRSLVQLADEADTLPLAPENEYAPCEVREIRFKTRRGLVYRVLFMIQGQEVFLLHVRGPGQDFLDAEDFAIEN